MQQIRLTEGEWQYDSDKPIGTKGGFGAVFEGSGEGNILVAIKRLKIKAVDSAKRELHIADYLIHKTFSYVMPIYDSGLDEASHRYFIVMPRAERSLQEDILEHGIYNMKESAAILLQIARGLGEVGGIVHRDLKPSNILLHNGKWRISDFGIARFMEESTSLNTLKGSGTPEYAAPEQWRLERASPATDIYALGCIAFALLTGDPPFPGPDFRDQHLFETPSKLNVGDPSIELLILGMLRKDPAARPSLQRVREQLQPMSSGLASRPSGSGFSQLAEVAAAELDKAFQEEAKRLEQEEVFGVRRRLASAGAKALQDLVEMLFDSITMVAPSAVISKVPHTRWILSIGLASLEISILSGEKPIPQDAFARSGWDVITGAVVKVVQTKPTSYEWSANLWYMNRGMDSSYRWWEASYFNPAMDPTRRPPYEPYALEDLKQADGVAAPGLYPINFAELPRPVDDEDAAGFFDRWAGRLASAARGELVRPQRFPLFSITE